MLRQWHSWKQHRHHRLYRAGRHDAPRIQQAARAAPEMEGYDSAALGSPQAIAETADCSPKTLSGDPHQAREDGEQLLG